MNWEWIVPVIVLVVWILTHVIRPEEQPAKEAPLPPPDDGQDAPPRPVSEVDRFLDEINRMRRRTAEEQGRPVEQEQPSRARRIDDIPTVLPAGPIPVVEPARSGKKQRVKRAPIPAPATTPVTPSPPPAAAITPVVSVPVMPVVTTNLRALLRTPSAVRNAILLQEILSAPRSQRPIRSR